VGLLDRVGMAEAIRASALVAVPSLVADVHPTIVIEALAHGRPVLGTDLGGIPELVGDAGWAVPPRDFAAAVPTALAAAAALQPVARQRYLDTSPPTARSPPCSTPTASRSAPDPHDAPRCAAQGRSRGRAAFASRCRGSASRAGGNGPPRDRGRRAAFASRCRGSLAWPAVMRRLVAAALPLLASRPLRRAAFASRCRGSASRAGGNGRLATALPLLASRPWRRARLSSVGGRGEGSVGGLDQ
jgi:hypothetical protein